MFRVLGFSEKSFMTSEIVHFYLNIKFIGQDKDRVEIHIDPLVEPPERYEHHFPIDFRSESILADTYVHIHVYFERLFNADRKEVQDVAVQVVKKVINEDEGLLKKITGGMRFIVIDIYKGQSRIGAHKTEA